MYYAKLLVSKKGKFLYDALNNQLSPLSDEIYEHLRGQGAGLVSEENYHRYLESMHIRDVLTEPDGTEIGHKYTADYLSRLSHDHRQLLILSLTNKCNMDCTYCVYHDKFSKHENINHTMSFETARKAIDEVLSFSQNVEAIRIGFYGGESLIEFDLIQQCVDYALSNANEIKIKKV